MKDIRIYQPGHYAPGDRILLAPEPAHHVGVVLRKKVGDPLILFCGDNQEFQCIIQTINKKRVEVAIAAVQTVNRESFRRIHLAQVISKGDRMENVVQKAVELGVASIWPLLSERCVIKLDEERMQKKQAQWQAIAVAACEQSGRNTVPLIHPIISLDRYLDRLPAAFHFVLYPEANKSWRDYQFIEGDIGLLIGPEGGLSTEETALLLCKKFFPLSLGPRVLRTETAALVALSMLQAVCGDL